MGLILLVLPILLGIAGAQRKICNLPKCFPETRDVVFIAVSLVDCAKAKRNPIRVLLDCGIFEFGTLALDTISNEDCMDELKDCSKEAGKAVECAWTVFKTITTRLVDDEDVDVSFGEKLWKEFWEEFEICTKTFEIDALWITNHSIVVANSGFPAGTFLGPGGK